MEGRAMTPAPASSTTPAAAAQRLAWGVVLLAAAFAGVSVVLTPASIRTTAMRFVIIALLGVLAGRGMRATRILLVLFTGLAALYAAVLAVVRPMPLGWRSVLFVYGVGTVWCLWGLFRAPAADHSARRSFGGEGGA